MGRNIAKFILLCAFSATLAGCGGSELEGVSERRLTAEELGVTQTIQKPLGFLVSTSRTVEKHARGAAEARAVARHLESELAATQQKASLARAWGRHAEADALAQNAKALAVRSREKANESIRLEQQRTQKLSAAAAFLIKAVREAQANGTPRLLYPDSMATLRDAAHDFIGLYRPLALSRRSGGFTAQDLQAVEARLAAIRAADFALARELHRRAPSDDGRTLKTTTHVEFAGLPLAVDISSGDVKLKWSNGFGPIKWTVAGGTGGSEGIKTLILRSGNTQRVYAVAGRKIFLHIPQSTLQTEGDRMVITTL